MTINPSMSNGSLPTGFLSQNITLLDLYLNKVINSIPNEYRSSFNPGYIPWKAADFISTYEEIFPDGTAGNCFIPADVVRKYSDIYNSLKYYSEVLACADKSFKNFKARCEFLSQFGYNEKQLRKFYDSSNNSYKLFEALHYFIFEELKLNETDFWILRHQLNYSNEYSVSNKEELPGKPEIEHQSLCHLTDVLEREIARYIFNFTALLPWFDYGEKLKLSSDFIKLTPAYLYRISLDERSKHITLSLLEAVLSVIYEYEKFTFIIDKSDKYVLIKKEILEGSGIPANMKRINIRTVNSAKEPECRTMLKRVFIMVYNLLPAFPENPNGTAANSKEFLFPEEERGDY
jgi:hypothetical protein